MKVLNTINLNTINNAISSIEEIYLEKETYIEDRAKHALKELKVTTHLQSEIDDLQIKFNHCSNKLSSIHSEYNNEDDICTVIHFGTLKILSNKKFSKFSKWLYKKLFGWIIEDYIF